MSKKMKIAILLILMMRTLNLLWCSLCKTLKSLFSLSIMGTLTNHYFLDFVPQTVKNSSVDRLWAMTGGRRAGWRCHGNTSIDTGMMLTPEEQGRKGNQTPGWQLINFLRSISFVNGGEETWAASTFSGWKSLHFPSAGKCWTVCVYPGGER